MEETKRGKGRPPGGKFTERLLLHAAPEDLDRLQQLADKWELSRAAAMRRAIREAIERAGTSEDEPKA